MNNNNNKSYKMYIFAWMLMWIKKSHTILMQRLRCNHWHGAAAQWFFFLFSYRIVLFRLLQFADTLRAFGNNAHLIPKTVNIAA